jgi:hypothetical protein
MSKYKRKGIKLIAKLETQAKPSKVNNTAPEQQNLPKKKVPGRPFVKNDPRINKEGRPEGSNNFKTDFLQAIKAIKNADTNKAIEITDIIRLSLEKMIKSVQLGDHRYDKVYIDLLNRYYGTPTQNLDHTSKGEKIDVQQIIGMRIVKDKDDENETQEE